MKTQQQRVFDLISDWCMSDQFQRVIGKNELAEQLVLLEMEVQSVTKTLMKALDFDPRRQQLYKGKRTYVYNFPDRHAMANIFVSGGYPKEHTL